MYQTANYRNSVRPHKSANHCQTFIQSVPSECICLFALSAKCDSNLSSVTAPLTPINPHSSLYLISVISDAVILVTALLTLISANTKSNWFSFLSGAGGVGFKAGVPFIYYSLYTSLKSVIPYYNPINSI